MCECVRECVCECECVRGWVSVFVCVECVFVCLPHTQTQTKDFSRKSIHESTSYSYNCFLMAQPTILVDIISRVKAVCRYLTISFIIISHIDH